jgi:uncharacterized protein YndB with AHSA1/START domain
MAVAAEDVVLRMKRVFDAPPERVFEAWTDPEQFGAWFGPPGMNTLTCELDVVVGGTWRLHAAGHGVLRAISGKYLEIVPPRRLVFTWAWHERGTLDSPREHESTVTLDFRPVGGRTEMVMTHGLFRDPTGVRNHDRGWTASFGKLDALLRRAT